MNRVTIAVIGFIFFVTGFLALLLGFIGLSLTPLMFLEEFFSPTGALISKLILMVIGFIMFYMARTADDESDEEVVVNS